MPLTDAKMFRLHAAHAGASKTTHKPRKVTDCDGLYILLQPTGSLLWRFAYRFDDKQKVLALGSYPDLSLRQARKAADDARDLLADGRDPAVERKAAKA
ncbi:Arm DNA-binding domain-containing protein, partial [Phenylobacterium sp.]|uniref:Arm DNA-binding domain-containing protein n=1 Tax=Phenylobacterium sp. TaxID=1871053 RepID=UPI0025F844A2